jgi:hypothetical protein
MSNAESSQAKHDARDMLLKEYDSLSESIWRNEATGETRVNWFLGIVTFGLGGSLKLISADGFARKGLSEFVALAGLLALVAFGVVTLFRIVRRDKRTDAMIESLDEIRRIFRRHFDEKEILAEYQPFGRPVDKLAVGKRERRPFGGLADLILTINSVLVGIFTGIASFELADGHACCAAIAGISAAVAFFFAFIAQYHFFRRER